jgi:hypothetical protein
LFRSRRPVPSLTNPMGNSNSMNTNSSQTYMLSNGHMSHGPTKKASSLSSQANPFSFLPSSTNQNKYANIPASLVSSMSNNHQRPSNMGHFIPTSNGQSLTPPPPPPHILNGHEIDQNYPPMNVSLHVSFSLYVIDCRVDSH